MSVISLKEMQDKYKQRETKSSWGDWVLNDEYQSLELIKNKRWVYEFDLERCTTAEELWVQINHISKKTWLEEKDRSDLILALSYLIGYQCKWSKK